MERQFRNKDSDRHKPGFGEKLDQQVHIAPAPGLKGRVTRSRLAEKARDAQALNIISSGHLSLTVRGF